MITKTNHGLVSWAQALLGQPYWYGTCCYPATSSLLASKTKQYPSHYESSRTARYKSDIAKGATVADCIGLVKGYYWTNDAGKVVYGLDGRPDKGANGMYTAAKVKGDIKTLPEIPGLLLYSSGHAGVYIGGGYAIEARGFAYGIVKTKVSERKWTHWYQCPYIQYLEGDAPMAEIPVGFRTLKYTAGVAMMQGEDVRFVQDALTKLGYQLGKIDGIYGKNTEAAVKAFQERNGLEVDGVVGSETRKALEGPAQGPASQETAHEDQPAENPPEDGTNPQGDGGSGTDFGTRLLKYVKGRKLLNGEDVRAVQTRLDTLGFPPGKLDGIYGPLTAGAVTAFQENRSIKVDGIVGPETRANLSK